MPHSVASNPVLPGLKQFRQDGCNSYLFFDRASGEAVLLDPRTDLMEDYRAFIAERRLKPLAVIDTSLQWHHLSGSHLFSESYGVPVSMSAKTDCRRATRKLTHGEILQVGRWELAVLSTPGVSPEAVCLLGAGLLFSGDTLLPATGARTDHAGGDPAALWKTLHEFFAPLPGATLVLPGHENQDLLFSTLEVERKRNPDWQAVTADELARRKAEEKPARGEGDFRRRQNLNAEAHPPASPESHFGGSVSGGFSGSSRGVASISVEKCALKLKEAASVCFLDVREPSEYAQGHLPGAIHIPQSELGLHLGKLAGFKRIYVYCQNGRRSGAVVRTLDYIGFPDAVQISGGVNAWEKSGLSLV